MDLQTIYPDWTFAEKHGVATQPGLPKDGESEQCPCCMTKIDKDPVPLCQNTKELQFLGFGFPLYFIFLKYTIIMLFLLVISYSSLSLSWAITHNQVFCLNKQNRNFNGQIVKCTGWMVFLSRIEDDVDRDENILRATSFIIQLFFLIYLRDKIKKTHDYYVERQTMISNYSILLQKLPKREGLRQKIKQFFSQKALLNQSVKTHEIVLICELKRYYQLKQQKIKLISQLQGLLFSDESKHKQEIEELRLQIDRVNKQIEEEQQISSQLIDTDCILCEKAIVVVDTEVERNDILKNFSKLEKDQKESIFGQGSEQIQIRKGPQPSQIIWQNFNESRANLIKRRILGWILFLILLISITAVFFFTLEHKGIQIELSLQIAKKQPNQSSRIKNEGLGLVILSILCIVSFNKFLFSPLLSAITKLEKHQLAADFQWSLCLKYSLGLVFTTAIMTLLVEGMRFSNYFQHQFGVIEEETMMFIVNGFLVPLIWFINPWSFYTIAKQRYYKGQNYLTQQQANELMEKVQYNIGKRYAEIIQFVWFTYFYSSAIPLGSILMLIGLCFFYWVDKYNLLRRSSVKSAVNGDLTFHTMLMLDLTLLVKPLGQFVFDSQIRKEWSVQSLVCILIGFAYLILPIEKILDYLHHQKFKPQQKTYEDTKEHFSQSYSSRHPILRKNNQFIQEKTKQKKASPETQQSKNINIQRQNLSFKPFFINPMVESQVSGHVVMRKEQCPQE